MIRKKLKVLTEQEYSVIGTKEPRGTYDRETREKLYWIIEKLRQGKKERTWFERGIYKKFCHADFGLLVRDDIESGGVIAFQGEVRVEGRFVGEIKTSGTLFIAQSGNVVGTVRARSVVCEGAIKGIVHATQKVVIHAKGTIEGDVDTPSFQIDPGGRLEGRCFMMSKASVRKKGPAQVYSGATLGSIN